MTIAMTVKSLGTELDGVAISRSTVRRCRQRQRTQIASEVKRSFQHDGPLVVHWDGKLIGQMTGESAKVERLPVIVTGENVEKLLNVPKLPSGKGQDVADAVLDALKSWGCTDSIIGMSFDTTASNTGTKSGACTLIEAALGRDLFSLACRHHMHEIVLGDVFKASFGASTAPTVSLFTRFRNEWDMIDKTIYRTSAADGDIPEHLATLRTEAVDFAKWSIFDTSALMG